MLENEVTQQEIDGFTGSVIQNVLNKSYGSPGVKRAVSKHLLKLTENSGVESSGTCERDREHMRIFDRFVLRSGTKFMPERERERLNAFDRELRDMSDNGGGAYPQSPNSFFVPTIFEARVWQMMKQVDRLSSRAGKDTTKQTAYNRWRESRVDAPSWADELMRARLLQ
jgi:hypothetical protein